VEKEYEIRKRGYEYTKSMMPTKMTIYIFKNITKKTEWQKLILLPFWLLPFCPLTGIGRGQGMDMANGYALNQAPDSFVEASRNLANHFINYLCHRILENISKTQGYPSPWQ
jgi:hypothetical protein